jgi:SprT-like family
MIVISKCRAKKFSNRDVLDAIEFFDRQLLSSRLSPNIRVTVKTKTRKKLEGADGVCDWEMNDSGRVRDFEILLSEKLSFKDMVRTLAHEMVHLKQYATGELKHIDRINAYRYNGKTISPDDLLYWDLPWEIEAYGREAGLYFRYMVHLDEKKSR